MKISARVDNSDGQHHIALSTDDASHSIVIPTKPTGFGSCKTRDLRPARGTSNRGADCN
jgi:hypothetical protein